MTGFISYADWLPFMAELAAKATLVLALTALVAALLWRSSAAVRHLVWCVGVVGVLALPVFSAVLPAWELPLLPARQAPAPAPAVAAKADLDRLDVAEVAATAPPRGIEFTESPSSAPRAWLPRAAAVLAVSGVAAGLLWLALGFWGVARLGRRGQVVGDAEWLRTAHEAAEQLGLRRPVLLLRSPGSVMPATGGLLWPVIVVPEAADGWSLDRRRAVLAHELAHVKRFDCLTQALAQVACALFWWHPAVWYAARRLRVERERACDDLVLRAGTRASEYAAHLLEIARAHRGMRLATPALVSMARPSHLESRLLWVLDAARARGVPSPRATLLSVLLGLLAVGSLSAMRPIAALAAGADGAPPRATAALVTADDDAAEHAVEHAVEYAEDAARDKKEDARDRARDKANDRARGTAAGDTFPPVEDLIAMRAVGVDAAYIAELRAAGYSNLTSQQLISLRALGVTGEYLAEMNDAGLGRLSAEGVAGLRAVGVTPGYIAELRSHGYTNLTAEQISGMRAVGVDGDFIAAMAGAGYRRIPPEHLAGMRAVGVTPEYVAELGRQGLRDVSVELLTGMRAVGVTGEYVSQMRAAGVSGLTDETLTGLRAVDVTPAYVREMASAGFTGLTAEQLTDLRAHRVTAEYVRELRAAGFADLSVDQLVQLRTSGVDRELMDARKKPRR